MVRSRCTNKYVAVSTYCFSVSQYDRCCTQILSRLRNARAAFDEPVYASLSHGPNPPSMYERELEAPRLNPPPLTQPCPHVFDSAPIRPVSVAIQEGVGMLLGGSGGPAGRGSVFGRLWSP